MSNVSAFLWEPNGANPAVYAAVKNGLCDLFRVDGSDCDQGADSYIDQAMSYPNKGPKYAVEGGLTACCGGHNVIRSNGIYYIPDPTINANQLSRLAAHEFTHVYQATKGDYPPAWMFEGGAVHMQALVSKTFPVTLGGMEMNSYSKTYQYMGGRSKSITNNTIAYYNTTLGRERGLKGGEDRCAGDNCGTALPDNQAPLGGAMIYDVGAMAIAFAINRANKTSKQFWTSSVLGEGFWNVLPAHGSPAEDWDYLNGHASQVKEGQGWKKVLAAFTGDPNVTAFYDAFDAWARTADQAAMLAILEADTAIETQMGQDANISQSMTSGMQDDMKNEQGTCKATTPGGGGNGKGYGGNGMCNKNSDGCPGPFGPKTCTNPGIKVGRGAPEKFRAATYTAGVKLHGSSAWGTVVEIPAGQTWNDVGMFSNMPNGTPRGCGTDTACKDIYKKMVLAYSPSGGCWPKEKGIPILANKDTTDDQMKTCLDVLVHHLMPRPKFFSTSSEILDAVIARKVTFNCGNNPNQEKGIAGAGYPNLPQGTEGGGASYYMPDTYAEVSGMCPGQKSETNPKLSDEYKKGGTRYGGHVAVEEFGHTIFDIAISVIDPLGWATVQKAEARAAQEGIVTRDDDWDCHTAATEYVAHGIELLLYNTRIGPNHKATSLGDMMQNDPYLFCLASRWFEVNNTFRVCNDGPATMQIPAAPDCVEILKSAETGITTTPGIFARPSGWTPAMGCPVLPSPPSNSNKTPGQKLKEAQDKLKEAKEKAKKLRETADQKKAVAQQKKAKAKAKIDELVAKVTNKEAKLRIKIIAGAKSAGVKMKEIKAELTATSTDDACGQMCAKSKADCVNEVLCEAEQKAGTRHLLGSAYEANLYVNPDVTKTDLEANLKAEDISATSKDQEPDMDMLNGTPGLDAADLEALNTEVAASATAAQEANSAETAAASAESEVTNAEKEVRDAAASVPPPPPPPLSSGGAAGTFTSILITFACTLAAALVNMA